MLKDWCTTCGANQYSSNSIHPGGSEEVMILCFQSMCKLLWISPFSNSMLFVSRKVILKQILLLITDAYKLQRIHCPPYCTLGFVFIAAIIPPQVVESENHQARTSIPRSQAAVYLISFQLSSCFPSIQFKNTNVFSSALVLDIILAISHYRVVLPDLSLCPHIPYTA